MHKMHIALTFSLLLGLNYACGADADIGEEETPTIEEGLADANVAEAVFRRLTRMEYNNTIRDLLGDTSDPSSIFPIDEETLSFDNNARGQNVSPLLAESYLTVSETLAANADLSAYLGCSSDSQQTCANDFVRDVGKRAYRRPLTESEVQSLLDVIAWGEESHDFETGLRLGLQAMLQSPHFLYRIEEGQGAPSESGVIMLTAYEIASRLSYLFWNSMPDQALFDAAEQGLLDTREGILAQAERMIADPRAKEMMAHFYRQWLHLDEVDRLQKDTSIFPGFNSNIARLLRKETETLIDFVIWEQDHDIREIFHTSRTFRNGALRDFYLEAGPEGDEFLPMGLDPNQRAGILSHGSILATQAKVNQGSPIHRGLFVREQLFCHIMPPPPDEFSIVIPDLDPNLSTRERFSKHREDPACAGCHQIMDPIGFGFENFDGVGRYRDTENGLPIDASGELTVTDVDGPFVGALGLAEKLLVSEDVQNCVVAQAFRFGYGRGEGEDDQQTLEDLRIEFAAIGGGLRGLFLAMTQTDAFLYRRKSN